MDDDTIRWHKASWGRSLIIITWSCVAVMIGMFIGSFFLEPLISRLALGVMPILILLITSLFVIRGFAVDGNHLLIKRLLWTDRIDLTHLTEAVHNPKVTRLSLKTWGNGGLFSFSGYFWNKRVGHYRAYITDPGNDIVLTINGKTVIISPDDAGDFAVKLNVLIQQQKET